MKERLYTIDTAVLVMSCGPSGRFAADAIGYGAPQEEKILPAVRRGMKVWIEEGKYTKPDELSARFACDRELVARAFAKARCSWTDLKPDFPDPLPQLDLNCTLDGRITLSGAPDVATLNEESVRVVSMGYGMSEHRKVIQANLVGLLAARSFGVTAATVVLVDLKSGARQTRSLKSPDLLEIEDQLVAAQKKTRYQPGSHCEGCPHRFSCPGRYEMKRAEVRLLTGEIIPPLSDLTDNRREELLAMADSLEQTANELRQRVYPVETGSVSL